MPHVKIKVSIRTPLAQRRQSTRTDKALFSGQTCRAGDRIQPRHEKSKMDSGLRDPNRPGFCRTPGRWLQPAPRSAATTSPGEARGLGVRTRKGNEAPCRGHDLGRRALPPTRRGHVCPREGRMSPPPHDSQVAVAFVFPSLFMSLPDPKSPAQSASGLALSPAMSGTLLTLQGFNE